MPVCQPLNLLYAPLPPRGPNTRGTIRDRWTARRPDVSRSVSLEPRKDARLADLNEPKTREAATKAGEPRLKEL